MLALRPKGDVLFVYREVGVEDLAVGSLHPARSPWWDRCSQPAVSPKTFYPDEKGSDPQSSLCHPKVPHSWLRYLASPRLQPGLLLRSLTSQEEAIIFSGYLLHGYFNHLVLRLSFLSYKTALIHHPSSHPFTSQIHVECLRYTRHWTGTEPQS